MTWPWVVGPPASRNNMMRCNVERCFLLCTLAHNRFSACRYQIKKCFSCASFSFFFAGCFSAIIRFAVYRFADARKLEESKSVIWMGIWIDTAFFSLDKLCVLCLCVCVLLKSNASLILIHLQSLVRMCVAWLDVPTAWKKENE